VEQARTSPRDSTPCQLSRTSTASRSECFFIGHPPPHFFAAYSGHEANVSIETGQVIEGHLPPNAAHLVKQWALAHRGELEDNWRRARAGMPLAKIVGLDDD